MKCKILNLIALSLLLVLLINCGGDDSSIEGTDEVSNENYNIYTAKSTAKDKDDAPEEIDPMEDKGIGPVKSITLAEKIDEELAKKGNELFQAKCTACHKTTKKFIGPNPTGVLERRTPEWIMNMILNPDVMVVKNAAAKKLMIEFNGAPMANQNLAEDEARSILEYFRTLN